jgi:hypothetical protein
MGPYVGTNAVLVGFFGSAALDHFVLWWESRRNAVLPRPLPGGQEGRR